MLVGGVSSRIVRVDESIRTLLCCVDHAFFFNDTATTEIYTLSLHDALPISVLLSLMGAALLMIFSLSGAAVNEKIIKDRKSTRLNSSHVEISYAVFCLKKKTTPKAPRSLTIKYWVISIQCCTLFLAPSFTHR